MFEDFDTFWRKMPTKWLQERTDGSKNAPGIGFEGPRAVRRVVELAIWAANDMVPFLLPHPLWCLP